MAYWHPQIPALSKAEGEVPKLKPSSQKMTTVPKTIGDQEFHLWPESGEPSPYETKPLFPSGLLDDEADLSLLAFRGDGDSTEDLDFTGLLHREYEECLSTQGEGRDRSGEVLRTGERMRTGLRLLLYLRAR